MKDQRVAQERLIFKVSSSNNILIDIEDKLDVDKKMSIVIDNISDLWSIQENDLDIDYLRLFFLLNYTYSQILCDERDFKNDSGVWLNIKDYIWIRKVVE